MSLDGVNCQPGLCDCSDPDPEPRVTVPLTYAGRCERYARQGGWRYDPRRISIDRLTPRQRRRALKKERHASPALRHREAAMARDPQYGLYNDGDDGAFYDGDYFDHGGADEHDLGYCVTPGCNCCGGEL